MAVRGAGGLLAHLQERPMSIILSNHQNDNEPVSLYVTRFAGDCRASQVGGRLREEVTAIVQSARPRVDRVLVVLESTGGTVSGYGLAAAQSPDFNTVIELLPVR